MKTIALVEIGNDGHRNAYMRLFIGALLELNCKIICLIPDPGPIQVWVNTHYPDERDRVTYIPLEYFRDKFPYAGKFRERLNILYNWYFLNKTIEQIETKYSLKTDLVFLNFLDAYLLNRTPPWVIDRLMKKKWSGLYFFPSVVRLQPELLHQPLESMHKDILFKARNCIGITLLDSGVFQSYSNRIGKPAILLPDIADNTGPNPQSLIAREIRSCARGRIVIGTIGLESHKCGYEFLQLAKNADTTKYFFAFTGPLYDSFLNYYPDSQASEILEFKNALPENCFWQTERIPDLVGDAEYNAVINAFDVVWVVYKNFYGSSNRLTKAAIFHKLVLSTNLYCIGENVAHYNLGEMLADTKIPTMINALDRLYTRIKKNDLPFENWEVFIQKNSAAVLKERFNEILSLL